MSSPRFRDITVTRGQADAVFIGATLPKYRQLTRLALAHVDELPLDAAGAMVSLIYNRGSRMVDLRPGDRREMRAIRAVLADGMQCGDLAVIAAQLRKMKRLWIGKGVDGLLARREAEARSVESAA